tara:strand:- start:602 stop:874 length:273 start_codon:yes stop_codon:yes gene_type:complete
VVIQGKINGWEFVSVIESPFTHRDNLLNSKLLIESHRINTVSIKEESSNGKVIKMSEASFLEELLSVPLSSQEDKNNKIIAKAGNCFFIK